MNEQRSAENLGGEVQRDSKGRWSTEHLCPSFGQMILQTKLQTRIAPLGTVTMPLFRPRGWPSGRRGAPPQRRDAAHLASSPPRTRWAARHHRPLAPTHQRPPLCTARPWTNTSRRNSKARRKREERRFVDATTAPPRRSRKGGATALRCRRFHAHLSSSRAPAASASERRLVVRGRPVATVAPPCRRGGAVVITTAPARVRSGSTGVVPSASRSLYAAAIDASRDGVDLRPPTAVSTARMTLAAAAAAAARKACGGGAGGISLESSRTEAGQVAGATPGQLCRGSALIRAHAR